MEADCENGIMNVAVLKGPHTPGKRPGLENVCRTISETAMLIIVNSEFVWICSYKNTTLDPTEYSHPE